MEYSVKVTIRETDYENTMVVRAFLTVRNADGAEETASVWQGQIDSPEVHAYTDPLSWVANLVALANSKLSLAWMEHIYQGKQSSMVELFKQ